MDLLVGLEGPSSSEPYPPKSGVSPKVTLLLTESVLTEDLREDDGVNQGLGGTATYAKFTMRLCVGVTLFDDVVDMLEKELALEFGVGGADILGI